MKIIIFGGGGFIGSNIADRLLKDGHSLKIFERPGILPYRKFFSHEDLQWLTGDIFCTHDLSKALDDVDLVIHLVSTTLPKDSNNDPIYDVQTNLITSINILELMVKKHIPKIIFISSGGTVYGAPKFLPIKENHPTEPMVSYGITKLAIEKYLLMYQSLFGIKVNILRVTNPYGERQRIESSQGAVGVFLNNAIQCKPIQIWGDGSVTRDYLYVSDVAEAFSAAVDYKGIHSIFNISSGVGTSLKSLVEKIELILSKKVSCNYQKARSFDVPSNILDNSLAKIELNWSPKVKLEEGLAKTAAWIQKNISTK